MDSLSGSRFTYRKIGNGKRKLSTSDDRHKTQRSALFDIYRAANEIIEQHGEDAPTRFAMRYDELLEGWRCGRVCGVEAHPTGHRPWQKWNWQFATKARLIEHCHRYSPYEPKSSLLS